MFRPSDILIDAFVKRLSRDYREAFGERDPAHHDTILRVARMVLARVARSDALYHDLVYTFLVTLVGQDILRGRIARDADVMPNDWVHFLASLLCPNVGIVRGACPGDDGNTCVIPTVIDQNPCAHLRMPRDMIFHGWSMRLFQAWQHSATMSS